MAIVIGLQCKGLRYLISIADISFKPQLIYDVDSEYLGWLSSN